MRKTLLFLGTSFVLTTLSIYGLSYQSGGLFGPTTTQSSTQINTQAERVSILQERQASTQAQISDLNREIKVLEQQITTLEREKEIANLELEELTTPNNPNLELPTELEENLENTIQTTRAEINAINTSLSVAQSTIKTNQESLEEAESKLTQTINDLTEETQTLRDELFIFAVGMTRYILIIAAYWILYQIARTLTTRYIKNDTTKDLITFSLTIITFIISSITLIFAFIGNLTLLLTSFGVLSAAMVVALQDLVSSFFAWILIRAKGPYKRRDIIEIPFNGSVVTGVVIKIGLLRTELKEKVGGNSLNRESLTGKHILFPNNLILKESLRNLTRITPTLWHQLDVIITFESNHLQAKQIVETIMQDLYKYMVDHHDQYLDNSYNFKSLYEPKVYLSIAADGPKITIWYAARAGMLREVLEKISTEILTQFHTHNIDLAYQTMRVIPTASEEVVDKIPTDTHSLTGIIGT